MRAHRAIFFADSGDVALQPCSRAPSKDVLKSSCDKIAQPDWLTLLAIRSDERVENRRNGDTWHARYRRFYTPIAGIGFSLIAATCHTVFSCQYLNRMQIYLRRSKSQITILGK